MDQIHRHRNKISVAKVNPPSSPVPLILIVWSAPAPKQKESSQLTDLCDDLIKRLSDRSLVPQQSGYGDIKRSAYCPSSS